MKNLKAVSNTNNKVLITMIWNGSASALNLLINMLVTSIVTNKIGTEANGFVSLANNFIMYATILTTSLNSYATRYISLEYHKKDYESTKKYFNSVLFTNLFVGAGILLVLCIITCKLDSFVIISKNIILDTKILFALMFLNFYMLLIGNTFLAACYIKNRLDLSGIYKALGYLVELLIIIYCFRFFNPQIWYIGVGYSVCGCITFFSSFVLYKKLTPDIPIDIHKYSLQSVKKLVLAGIWNSINSLGNALNNGLDLLISNLLLSPFVMGEISIAKTLGSVQSLLYQLVSQAFQPIFLKVYAEGNKTNLLKQLEMAMKTSGFISGVFFVGFVILGDKFYLLWIPNQNTEKIYMLTVITLLSYLLEGVVGPLYYIYTLTIKNKIPCIITVISGLVNVGAKFILLKTTNLGAFAVVSTTTLVMIFINLIPNPLYMSRCLHIKWSQFYPTILRYILFVIFDIVILKVLFIKINTANWLIIIGLGIIICLISAILYFIVVLNRNEKKFLVDIVKEIKR